MNIGIGSINVARVEENLIPAFPPNVLLPDLPDGALDRHMHWLAPSFYDPAAGMLIASFHSWVVRTKHHIVLIDTCAGNCKNRPAFEPFNQLNTPWLDRLAAAGVTPEQVDFVMCTHLHLDHVGWNTQLKGGRWVPTFPNAKYLFGKREYEDWMAQDRGPETIGFGVLEDSVLPVIQAGQSQLVEGGYAIDDALTVEAAPGHTLGHNIVRARDGSAHGMFSGDMMHSPLQVPYPDVNSGFCADPAAARATRRRVLQSAVETNALVLPAHFGVPHCGRVRADGDAFRWMPGI